MADLTPRQTRFVDEFLVDLNATQAAIRAGYSPASARSTGQETLQNPVIRDAIDEALEERSRRTGITQDYVLRTIVETIERCRSLHPLRDKRGELVRVETENGQECVAVQYNPKMVLQGCDLLGKHLGMWKLALTDPDGQALGTAMAGIELARRAAFLLAHPEEAGTRLNS